MPRLLVLKNVQNIVGITIQANRTTVGTIRNLSHDTYAIPIEMNIGHQQIQYTSKLKKKTLGTTGTLYIYSTQRAYAYATNTTVDTKNLWTYCIFSNSWMISIQVNEQQQQQYTKQRIHIAN